MAKTAGSIRAVTEKYAPARRQAPVNAEQYSPESAESRSSTWNGTRALWDRVSDSNQMSELGSGG